MVGYISREWRKHAIRRSSLVCSEKVTSCSRKSCLSCPIPGASEPQAMNVHMLSREPSQAVLWHLQQWIEKFTRPVNSDAVKKYFA
jgi:hypothetical protein